MSLINKEISDFSAQAYQNGEFRTVTKQDVLGKWSLFFFYPADFTFVCQRDGRLAVRCDNAAPPGAAFGATSKPDARNHGLGLPAMRQIVECHRGALLADVEDGTAVVRIALRLDDA